VFVTPGASEALAKDLDVKVCKTKIPISAHELATNMGAIGDVGSWHCRMASMPGHPQLEGQAIVC
jgi:hypothetical protein